MKMLWAFICSITLVGVATLGGLPSAQALTMKECSAKYKVAQQAGTLQGMKWSDFARRNAARVRPLLPLRLLAAARRRQPPLRENTERERKCRLPNGRFTKIFQRVSGQGENAHLP